MGLPEFVVGTDAHAAGKALPPSNCMSRNLSEAIVDKDNHAADASKYIVMSHPEPTRKSYDKRVAERVEKLCKDRHAHRSHAAARRRSRKKSDEG